MSPIVRCTSSNRRSRRPPLIIHTTPSSLVPSEKPAPFSIMTASSCRPAPAAFQRVRSCASATCPGQCRPPSCRRRSCAVAPAVPLLSSRLLSLPELKNSPLPTPPDQPVRSPPKRPAKRSAPVPAPGFGARAQAPGRRRPGPEVFHLAVKSAPMPRTPLHPCQQLPARQKTSGNCL